MEHQIISIHRTLRDDSCASTSSARPTYAAVLSKSLHPPAMVAEAASDVASSLSKNLKGEGSESSSEGLAEESSPVLVQDSQSQSQTSTAEKDAITVDDTDQKQESLKDDVPFNSQAQSTTQGPMTVTGPHNNTQRFAGITTGYGSKIRNANLPPQHHGRINQNWNTRRSFHGIRGGIHMPPRGPIIYARPPLQPPPPLPRPPLLTSCPYNHLHPSPMLAPVPPPPYNKGPYGFSAGLGPHHFPYGAVRRPPICVQAPNPADLYDKIVDQVDFYFSFNNLVKDIYLRKQMDDQGWVPIGIIASFPKVKQLTGNVQIIADALKASSVIEILRRQIHSCGDGREICILWIEWELGELPDKCLGETTPEAAKIVAWVDVSFVFPLIAAFVAGSYLGRFKTIIFSSIIYFL
ncbi:la-related protein 1B-like, partial [Prosopis cineraria]|uniref:la-related protein 1B-like n=1 Tax=Prosopis cineraria TaxID=364024 RepID=UPI00240FE9DD